jgi:excisionase family DNA binding protein
VRIVAFAISNETLWTIDDVSDYLRVPARLVRYWVRSSDIPHIRLGRQLRFIPDAVRKWTVMSQSLICGTKQRNKRANNLKQG